MFSLGQKVYIISDSFEQNLPVREHGFILAYDRNVDNAFDYLIRVPKSNKHFYVPSSDIELEEVLIQKEVEKIERDSLIDYALATKNKLLFDQIMNGEPEEMNEEERPEVLSSEEFVKQINLKAWI